MQISDIETIEDPTLLTPWVKRALNGEIPLPCGFLGYGPDGSLLSYVQTRSRDTKLNLMEAVEPLVLDFVDQPFSFLEKTDYVTALVRLALGLKIPGIMSQFLNMAENVAVFKRLPFGQQRVILHSLLDSKIPIGGSFWTLVSLAYGPEHRLSAVTGLLRSAFILASPAIASLPNTESVADSLYVIMDQYRSKLKDPTELDMALTPLIPKCEPMVQSALKDIQDLIHKDFMADCHTSDPTV